MADLMCFGDAHPVDEIAVQGTMEEASDHEDYMGDSAYHDANSDDDDDVDVDEDFELDGLDNGSSRVDYDSDDYDDAVIGKKRKRIDSEATLGDSRQTKQTDARTKTEGGESFVLDEGTSPLSHFQSTRVIGKFGRHDRQQGDNLPAYHKRVSADLDPDDALMLEMREKGFSDRQIAEKLAKEGRVRYDQKSISTRIMRIRLAQAEKFDHLLQEGLKEWEMEDDQCLAKAYALADIEISYEIERVRAWRFRKVSEYMRRLNKDSRFSANACRIRYGELMSGTARIPCDIDDDPDARREQLELFRSSREAARDKNAADYETRAAMEKQVKDALKIKNAQKAEETANKRAAREQEKAQRLMQRAAQAQLRSQKAAENQKAKMERNAQIKKAAASTASKPGKKTQTAATAASSKAPSSSSNPKTQNPEAIDPRIYLSLPDLITLCTKRGIPTTNKDAGDLVTSLADADKEWSHEELRKMCKAKGLNVGGSKVVMRYQLAMKAAQGCASFEMGRRKAGEGKGEGGEGVGDRE